MTRGLVPDLSYEGMAVVEAGIERAKLIGADGEWWSKRLQSRHSFKLGKNIGVL